MNELDKLIYERMKVKGIKPRFAFNKKLVINLVFIIIIIIGILMIIPKKKCITVNDNDIVKAQELFEQQKITETELNLILEEYYENTCKLNQKLYKKII